MYKHTSYYRNPTLHWLKIYTSSSVCALCIMICLPIELALPTMHCMLHNKFTAYILQKHIRSYNRKLSQSSSTIQDTCFSVLAISSYTRNYRKLPLIVPNCHNSFGLPPTNQLPLPTPLFPVLLRLIMSWIVCRPSPYSCHPTLPISRYYRIAFKSANAYAHCHYRCMLPFMPVIFSSSLELSII